MTSFDSRTAATGQRTGVGPAPLFVLGSMSVLQLGLAFSREIFAELGVGGTTLLRLAFAALVLTIATRPKLRGKPLRQLIIAVVLGIASCGLTLLFAAAIARIPLALASTIEFLGPFGVALARSQRVLDVVWAVVAVAGVVLITLVGGGAMSGRLDPVGLGFAACAALCWAAYIIFTSKVGAAFEGFQGIAISMMVATVAAVPFGIREAWHGLATSRAPLVLLLTTAGVAIMVPVVPYMLEMAALRRLPEHVFSILMSLEPGIAALMGLIVLSQALGAVQVAGIGCVISASVAATVADHRRARNCNSVTPETEETPDD